SAAQCPSRASNAPTNPIWNPLTNFTDVAQDNELGNIQSIDQFRAAASSGTLPAISWIMPTFWVSDHPNAWVSDGQAWVTILVNDIMRGRDWSSTAICVAWDDWGSFYDHVIPPVIDGNGDGFRVPSLVISPYAKQHYIDHQTLSFDAYLKFI